MSEQAAHLAFDDDPPPPLGPAALEVRDVVLDPVFAKRRDALLRTVPLHELVERAARVDPRFGAFDVRALALAAFDAVIARQGFPNPATPAAVAALLAGIAGVQHPGSGEDLRLAVAEHVLDGLTNRRERERQFSLTSFIYSTGASDQILATAVPRPFWLLREQENAATGGLWLEASADAINALVGGLDISIEDHQRALEYVLERQLDRGDLDAAHVTAEKSRRLTAALTVEVTEMLAMTEQHVQSAGWHDGTAGRLIDRSLLHIQECLQREGVLIEHVRAGRDSDASSGAHAAQRARTADRLTVLLEESRSLHVALLTRVMGARARFLDAQDASLFRPPATTFELDIGDGLFAPFLALRAAEAVMVAQTYLRCALGPEPPALLNWGDAVDALLRPAADAAEPEAPDDTEIDFRDDPPPLVDAALLDRTRRVVWEVGMPARLSALIAACPDDQTDLAAPHDLICAAAVRGWNNGDDPARRAAPDRGGAAEAASEQVLRVLGDDVACGRDGLQLDGPGWSGDDLIVCADRDQLDAVLLFDTPAPEPARLQGRHRRRSR